MAAASRLTPPAFGSEARRQLTRELHQRLLDSEALEKVRK